MNFLAVLLVLFSTVSFRLDKVICEKNGNSKEVPIPESLLLDTFSDDWISIIWKPSIRGFGFELENKSSSSLSLIWDESAYINQRDSTSKIINETQKFINKDQSVLPSTIPLQAKINNFIIPSSNIYYSDKPKFKSEISIGRAWKLFPLYFEDFNQYTPDIQEMIKTDAYKIRIILAIQKGTEKRLYHFFFIGEAR